MWVRLRKLAEFPANTQHDFIYHPWRPRITIVIYRESRRNANLLKSLKIVLKLEINDDFYIENIHIYFIIISNSKTIIHEEKLLLSECTYNLFIMAIN